MVFSRSRVGSAIIELAIAIPVLTLLAIGVADFGRMFYSGIAVANAARAAAEYGARSVTTFDDADTATINLVGREESGDTASVKVTTERFCRCPDGSTPACDGTCTAPYTWTEVFVKAKAQKTITLLIPYPGLRQTMTFRDSATFRAQ